MTDTALHWRPAWQLREEMAAGQRSPVEVTEAFLARIAAADGRLHGFITVAADAALATAARLERERAAGQPPGPLFGVPVSVKDLYWTRDMVTTAGSLLYRDFRPAQDAVHVERLRAAGAVVIGKTNLPEFALYPRTVNRLTAECRNPWDLDRTSGGSSGGSAATVAAGLTPLTIASDGGGSTRIPAALCGAYGLYPSNGLLPRHGGIGATIMFSNAGPISRDVRDAALLLQALAGADPRDPASDRSPVPDYLAGLDEPVAGLRMHWTGDCGDVPGIDERAVTAARSAAGTFAGLGAEVAEAAGGLAAERWMESFYTMLLADRYASIGQQLHTDPAARGLLSEYGRSHFARGAAVTGAEYSRALNLRSQVIAHLDGLLDGADVLLTPTVGGIAPAITGPIERGPLVAYTFIVNYAGFAAATLPCGFVDGLPVGLQVIGRPRSEALLLRVSRAFERAGGWAGTRPPGFAD
ncbi:MAG TPA: amidase [Streptosporangiaceae bacterium]